MVQAGVVALIESSAKSRWKFRRCRSAPTADTTNRRRPPYVSSVGIRLGIFVCWAVGAFFAERAPSICEGAMGETKRHELTQSSAAGNRRVSAADQIAVDFVKLLRDRPPVEVEILFIRIQSILRETVPADQARQMLRRYAELYERDAENF